MIDNALGTYIKYCREVHDMTLRGLAKKAEVSPSQLSKIERGLSIPSREILYKIAYAINVDKDELLVLGGYIDEAAMEGVIKNLYRDIYSEIYSNRISEAVNESRSNYIIPLEDGLKSLLIESESVINISEEDIDFIVREMKAAYNLSMMRIKNRR